MFIWEAVLPGFIGKGEGINVLRVLGEVLPRCKELDNQALGRREKKYNLWDGK